MWRVFIVLMGLGVAAGQQSEAHGPKRSSVSRSTSTEAARLVVSDANTPTIRVIDIASGRTVGSFAAKGPARLHAGASGRYVYAVQADAGQVAIVDTGIATEGHGDHDDIKITRPRLLPTRLEGSRPSHVTYDNARIAVFFDGDGTARVFPERDLIGGRTRTIQRIETGAKHHGVVQPIGRHIAVTVPPNGDGLPNSIELRGPDRATAPRMNCDRLHGEGRTGRFVAFGCADGVVIYETGRDGVTGRSVSYAKSLPTGRLIRNMSGAAGFAFLVGDFGADGMVVLDPSAADGDFRFIPLPSRRMHFHLHPEPGDKLFVIVEDGTLIRINPITGQTTGQAQVTNRYSMDQGVVRPRVASVGRYVTVSNPATGEIVILDADTMEERRRINVGGAPFDVLAVGSVGASH